MENKKIPFFKRVKYAIFNLEKYQELSLEKTSVAVKYFLKLILLFAAIVCIAITYEYSNIVKTGIDIIKNDLPDFAYENSVLTSKAETPTIIDKTMQRGDVAFCIVVDTNVGDDSEELKEYVKKLNLYNMGAIFLKDKVILKMGVPLNSQTENTENSLNSNIELSNNMQIFSYQTLTEQYNLENFDKQFLIEQVDNINLTSAYIALYLTLLIFMFASYVISTLLETALLFVLGYLVAKIVKLKMKNSSIYNLGLYAITLPIILNAVYIVINILTGFEIKYFQLMYTAISYIYLITAILMIRSDLIKQQAEVQKIQEVQKEVKEKIEERKEDQDKKTEDKNKEEKKEEKDTDVGINGETPEGTA